MNARKILVLDVGGTAVKIALMDENQTILEREERSTPKTSQAELLDMIRELYEKYRLEAEGISISMPGIIDSVKGYIYTGGALVYNCDCEFQKLAEEACGTKVVIENDAKCALMAEMWCGCLADVNDGIVLILGTGVGGGIMINRQLVRGTHFSAGEVSFCCLDHHKFSEFDAMAGRRCGSAGLVEMAKAKLHIDDLDGRRLFAMMEEGNVELEKVFQDYCHAVAILIYNLQVILDVQRTALGGGISQQPKVLAGIQEQLDRIYASEMIQAESPSLPRPELVTCKYFNDSNLIGALVNYLHRYQ